MLSSDKNVETIAQLIEVLKHYLGLQTEYLKLDVIDKVVRLLKAATLALIFILMLLPYTPYCHLSLCHCHFLPSLLNWFIVISMPASTKLLIISQAVSILGCRVFISSSSYLPSTQSTCMPRGKSLPMPIRRRA